MSQMDRKRIAAVAALEGLGCAWRDGSWHGQPGNTSAVLAAADMMRAILLDRADVLAGCIEGGDGEAELEAIGTALHAYDGARWPDRNA